MNSRLTGLCIFTVYSLLLCVLSSQAEPSLYVLDSPAHQKYSEAAGPLMVSDFNNILLAANGFTVEAPTKWMGLKTTDALSVPKVTLLFLINNENLVSKALAEHTRIPIVEDGALDFSTIKSRYEQAHSAESGSVGEFNTFPTLKDFVNLQGNCANPSINMLYLVKITGGDKESTEKGINELVKLFKKQCITDSNNDLLTYLLVTSEHQMVKRAATQKLFIPSANNRILNRAEFYSDQYPAMFNLLFWTSVVIGLFVFAAAYMTCYMDPGLDTVIYRMTSQRIKKDQ